jgi:hypothetical protein
MFNSFWHRNADYYFTALQHRQRVRNQAKRKAIPKEQERVIDELVRILHNTGSICWEVGNFIKDGEVFPLDVFYYNIFKERGLKL